MEDEDIRELMGEIKNYHPADIADFMKFLDERGLKYEYEVYRKKILTGKTLTEILSEVQEIKRSDYKERNNKLSRQKV